MRFINRAFALAGAVIIMAAAGSATAAWNYQGKPGKPHRLTLEAAARPPSNTTHPIRRQTIKPFEQTGTVVRGGATQQQTEMKAPTSKQAIRKATTKPFNPGFGARVGG